MAAFAGGSFNKLIFNEESIINCNRVLQGLDLSIDPQLKEKLKKSLDTKSFLTIGDISIYRKEQRVTQIFDKRGISSDNIPSNEGISLNAEKEINRRCAEYILPERSKTQKELLSNYLPTPCKY